MQGSGATHVEGDTQAQDEWQRPWWLWDLLIKLLHVVPEYYSFFCSWPGSSRQMYVWTSERWTPWSSWWPQQLKGWLTGKSGWPKRRGGCSRGRSGELCGHAQHRSQHRRQFPQRLYPLGLQIPVWNAHIFMWSNIGKVKHIENFTIFLNLCLAVRGPMSPILASRILP